MFLVKCTGTRPSLSTPPPLSCPRHRSLEPVGVSAFPPVIVSAILGWQVSQYGSFIPFNALKSVGSFCRLLAGRNIPLLPRLPFHVSPAILGERLVCAMVDNGVDLDMRQRRRGDVGQLSVGKRSPRLTHTHTHTLELLDIIGFLLWRLLDTAEHSVLRPHH